MHKPRINRELFRKLCEHHTARQIADMRKVTLSSVNKWSQRFNCEPQRRCRCGYIGPSHAFANAVTCVPCSQKPKVRPAAVTRWSHKKPEVVPEPLWPVVHVSEACVAYLVQGQF